jgi:hypothetical protein
MNNQLINEYIAGGTAGLTQVIIGYPLDTIKTNLQSGFKNTQSLTIKQLLKGIKYPLYSSVISNIAFFGNYDLLYKYTNSTWISGAITGAIGSIVLNPFEIRKVRQQYVNQPGKLRGYSSIYGGLSYTIYRESIANAFYFSIYHYMHNSGYNSFIAGGFAGINSWFWTYPLDVIKTRKQLNISLTFLQCVKIGGLWNGLGIALIRGFIVNGSSFWIYDRIKYLIHY